jgi:GT2 family glycosyltransferase
VDAVETRASLQEALTVIRTGENLGFAGGMNVGIRYACERGADFVWLLNNDTVVAPDALTRLVDGIRDLDRVGIAGPVELDYSHPERVVGSIGVVRPWKGATGGIPRALHFGAQGCATVELISGFSMLVNVAAIHAVGVMDERFFLYAEETEWCVRMRRGGWKVVYVPASKVWHKGSQSTGWGSPLMYYYVTRNQLRLFAMHFPYAVPFALARSVLRMVKLLRHGRWPQCKAAGRGLLDWARGRLGRLPAGPEDGETRLEAPKSAGGNE